MASIFGHNLRISSFGESHGAAVGVIIDGVPPRLVLTREDIQVELDRRRPGQSDIVTPRDEKDQCEILSGVLDDLTLGTSLAVIVRNEDQRSSAYNEMSVKYRPSHADYTYDAKYGIRAWAGGGRASARETIARVIAGVVAKKILQQAYPHMQVLAWVESVGELRVENDPQTITAAQIEASAVRCGDARIAEQMIELIKQVRSQGDSIGGTVRCIVRGAPAGLGSPVFDKLDADLAKAMLSLPACKGFAIGSGFEGTRLRGSQHNDAFYMEQGRVRTRSNNSGGVQGGISNGEIINFVSAFKPTATIMLDQHTVDKDLNPTTLKGRGRHDACVLPRAVPIVEAMTWLVLADHYLGWRAQCAQQVQNSLQG